MIDSFDDFRTRDEVVEFSRHGFSYGQADKRISGQADRFNL
jgi:hypothetical protein